ncbi:MAG: hypothetical protein J5808_05315 [Paludibacteraceae bacterium]|nr:hypothetical protein [Paludibacteraceae bacterium]
MKTNYKAQIKQLKQRIHTVCDAVSDNINQWSLRTRKTVLIVSMGVAGLFLLTHWLLNVRRMIQMRQSQQVAEAIRQVDESVKREQFRIDKINAPLSAQDSASLQWLYSINEQLEKEEQP